MKGREHSSRRGATHPEHAFALRAAGEDDLARVGRGAMDGDHLLHRLNPLQDVDGVLDRSRGTSDGWVSVMVRSGTTKNCAVSCAEVHTAFLRKMMKLCPAPIANAVGRSAQSLQRKKTSRGSEPRTVGLGQLHELLAVPVPPHQPIARRLAELGTHPGHTHARR